MSRLLADKDRLDVVFTMRITPTERKAFERDYKRAGHTSISEWLRDLARADGERLDRQRGSR
jgi:hypothetical protein